jgi:hypothetical protein
LIPCWKREGANVYESTELREPKPGKFPDFGEVANEIFTQSFFLFWNEAGVMKKGKVKFPNINAKNG